MDKKKQIVTGLSLALFVLLAAWALGWFGGKKYSDDPQVAELEKLRDENVGKLEAMPEDQRRTEGDAMRERMQGLTEEQRKAFFESSMPIFVPMMARQFEKHYDEFMAKSPEEQRKALDKAIDDMKGGGPGGGRGGPPNMDPKRADEFRKKMLDWTTPEQRAKFDDGIRRFNERRQERGMDPLSGPGGGFF